MVLYNCWSPVPHSESSTEALCKRDLNSLPSELSSSTAIHIRKRSIPDGSSSCGENKENGSVFGDEPGTSIEGLSKLIFRAAVCRLRQMNYCKGGGEAVEDSEREREIITAVY